MRIRIIGCCLAALLLGACHKEENPSTLQDRLQAHTWRLASLTDNGVPYHLDDCQLDDREVYFEQTGYDDRGPVKCGAGDPQQTPFAYTVLPDEQTIAITEGTSGYQYESVHCDDHSLRMTRIIQQDTLVISWLAE